MAEAGRRGAGVAAAIARMSGEVKRGNFDQARRIGEAAPVPLALHKQSFGDLCEVQTGAQATLLRGAQGGTPVVLKIARIRTSQDLFHFRREVANLSSLAHPNVIPLLGARLLPPDYFYVMPFQPGSLAERLHAQAWRPGWAAVWRLASETAAGLEAIHAAGIVHRDIKAHNILLGEAGQAIIGDFGLAATAADIEGDRGEAGKPSGGFHKRNMVGTLEYMAPEVLQRESASRASDVYAWAVTINEAASGTFPYSDCARDAPQAQTVLNFNYSRQDLAAAVAGAGLRPTLRPDTPTALAALLEACWHAEPGQRPSAANVTSRLRAMSADLPAGSGGPASAAGSADRLPGQVSDAAAVPLAVPEASEGRGNAGVQSGRPSLQPNPPSGAAASSTANAGDSGGQPTQWLWPEWGPRLDEDAYLPAVTVGAREAAGRRGEDRMEDAHVVLSLTFAASPSATAHAHALAIFDGHRGAACAQFAQAQFAAQLRAGLSRRSAAAALTAVFAALDEGYRQQDDAAWAGERVERTGADHREWPGCTALAALLLGPMLYVANAGDCRAVLCRGGAAVELSRDHTADDPAERGRVQAAGGALTRAGDGWRIGAAGLQVTRGDVGDSAALSRQRTEMRARRLDDVRLNNMLSVKAAAAFGLADAAKRSSLHCRQWDRMSLGDADLKCCGVVAAPEVATTRLTPADEFLILASDGLWETLSSQDAVGLVHDTVKDAKLSANRLVNEALMRGSSDNVTAIVAILQPVGSLEKIFGQGIAARDITSTAYGSGKAAWRSATGPPDPA